MEGTALKHKLFYDDANGVPVEITAEILQNSSIKIAGKTEETTPFGPTGEFPQHTPTGAATTSDITLSGIFRDGEDGEVIDPLFRDRVPESPDTDTRTFREVLTENNRSRAVETRLISYDPEPNRENGLTRFTIVLRPTGTVTEAYPS